jgi:hypothetical protein
MRSLLFLIFDMPRHLADNIERQGTTELSICGQVFVLGFLMRRHLADNS